MLTTPNGLELADSGANRELVERIAELEFAREDREWIALANAGSPEFARDQLITITRLARLMYLKNPLVNRGISVKAYYVFGRGLNIVAKDETINAVIQAFLEDEPNQRELTSQQARVQKEVELETDGNIFFTLFVHPITGRVRVRTIPVDEVTDVICNPKDKKEPWYYRREWVEEEYDLDTGERKETAKIAYYPDFRYKPQTPRSSIGKHPVERALVYHVKIGGFSDWKFGLSEAYSALDWAKAYKKFLENWATITQAYARFAFKMTVDGSSNALAAAKARIGTTIGNGSGETNPPNTPAGTFIARKDKADIEPMRTAGATTTPADGRHIKLMIAAGQGLPETFYGDPSTGNLATAKTLDRPTELGFLDRQTLWVDVYEDLLQFVIYCAVAAPLGELTAIGKITANEYGEAVLTWDDDINAHIDIDFPPILVRDLAEQMNAINQSATYIPDQRELARMVLTALGENDIDETLDRLYPPAAEPTDELPTDDLAQAIEGLREALVSLRESVVAV